MCFVLCALGVSVPYCDHVQCDHVQCDHVQCDHVQCDHVQCDHVQCDDRARFDVRSEQCEDTTRAGCR